MSQRTSEHPGLSLVIHAAAEAVTVDVVGELDLVGGPELARCVEEQVEGGRRHIRLDLTGLSFCDARGLSALVDARERVDGAGGELVLAGAPAMLRRAMTVTGLDDRLFVEADLRG